MYRAGVHLQYVGGKKSSMFPSSLLHCDVPPSLSRRESACYGKPQNQLHACHKSKLRNGVFRHRGHVVSPNLYRIIPESQGHFGEFVRRIGFYTRVSLCYRELQLLSTGSC